MISATTFLYGLITDLQRSLCKIKEAHDKNTMVALWGVGV